LHLFFTFCFSLLFLYILCVNISVNNQNWTETETKYHYLADRSGLLGQVNRSVGIYLFQISRLHFFQALTCWGLCVTKYCTRFSQLNSSYMSVVTLPLLSFPSQVNLLPTSSPPHPHPPPLSNTYIYPNLLYSELTFRELFHL